MLTKVEACGDDLCLLIPQELARQHGIEVGSELKIRVKPGAILAMPQKRQRYDLEELLASVPEGGLIEEWDIGPAVGKERWWLDEDQTPAADAT